MQMLQIYASELAKFDWLNSDPSTNVLVAGEGIVGVFHTDDASTIDPVSLVGTGASSGDPEAVAVGSTWAFRADKPIVIKEDNGARFAFLNPAGSF